MTGQLINALKEYCESLHLDYQVEYNEASAMNRGADYIANDKGLIFIEEVKNGEIEHPSVTGASRNYFYKKTVSLSIWFCRFSTTLGQSVDYNGSEYDKNAQLKISDTRQFMRNTIEEEVVNPFCLNVARALSDNKVRMSVARFPFAYPTASRFDSNEVSVVLNINITQTSSCPNSLK